MTYIINAPAFQAGTTINANPPALTDATIPQLAALFDLTEQLEHTLLGFVSQPRAEGVPADRADELMLAFDEERLAIVKEMRTRRPATPVEAERRMAVLVRHALADGESVRGVLQVALECAAERH